MQNPINYSKSKMAKYIFSAARIAGFSFGFPILLGYLMFDHRPVAHFYFAITLLAVWGVSIIPRVYFSLIFVKWIVRSTCIAAAIATAPMIYGDLTLIYGADYPATILRFFIVLIELILFAETFKKQNLQ